MQTNQLEQFQMPTGIPATVVAVTNSAHNCVPKKKKALLEYLKTL